MRKRDDSQARLVGKGAPAKSSSSRILFWMDEALRSCAQILGVASSDSTAALRLLAFRATRGYCCHLLRVNSRHGVHLLTRRGLECAKRRTLRAFHDIFIQSSRTSPRSLDQRLQALHLQVGNPWVASSIHMQPDVLRCWFGPCSFLEGLDPERQVPCLFGGMVDVC